MIPADGCNSAGQPYPLVLGHYYRDTFNGIGIPLAATGLVYPVWAMAASVTAIFVNSLGGRPGLLFAAIGSVGRPARPGPPPATATAASTIPGGARA